MTIDYNDYFLKNSDEYTINLKCSYKNIDNNNINIFRLLESYIKFLFVSLSEAKTLTNLENCRKKLADCTALTITNDSYKNYYSNLLSIILDHIDGYDNNDKSHLLSSYNKLVDILFNSNSYKFDKNSLIINIDKNSYIEEINEFIIATIDEVSINDLTNNTYAFYNFFDYSISHLSDGEAAYLGIFSGLYEQIKTLANDKEKYILTFDEPEIRMHPELARNFINSLIEFLGSIREKNQSFQIIIATHSPLLLSDIPKENIVFLEKENNIAPDGLANKCIVSKKEEKVNTFGQNIHLLFKNSLFVDSTIGEFARRKINALIKAVSGEDENNIISEAQYNQLKNQINIIAEDILRDKLLYMLEECFNKSLSNEEQLIRKLEADKRKIDEQLRLLKRKG